ncbi:hypothetical protein LTR66_008892 [Elasticomyces elasticus]|nr:hypothetical protein LTR66_008892 [Elasticomyces elasticus]
MSTIPELRAIRKSVESVIADMDQFDIIARNVRTQGANISRILLEDQSLGILGDIGAYALGNYNWEGTPIDGSPPSNLLQAQFQIPAFLHHQDLQRTAPSLSHYAWT